MIKSVVQTLVGVPALLLRKHQPPTKVGADKDGGFQRLFKGSSEIVQSFFRDRSEIAQRFFRDCSEVLQKLFRDCLDVVQSSSDVV